MPTIAVFIPVYSKPKSLVKLVGKLSAEDFPDSLIVVAVDGQTTPEIAAALSEIRNLAHVRIMEGNPHEGKVATLNRAVAGVDSPYLVFFDNDVSIPDEVTILQNCFTALQEKDLVEFPKLGTGKGLLASMVKLELLANIIGSDILMQAIGQCPSINGAGFAVRRELYETLGGFPNVVNEDMDFAGRAFLNGARYGIYPSMRILDEVPETLRVWYKQRKRWAICTALWGRTYIGKAMHTSRKAFWSLAISGIVFPLPFITALLAVLAVIFSPLGAATGLSSAWPIIVSVGLFLACGLLHWHYARKYHAKFSWLAFIPYSLIYLPIWGASSAIGSIMVSRGSLPSLDWKYSPNPPKTSDPPKAN